MAKKGVSIPRLSTEQKFAIVLHLKDHQEELKDRTIQEIRQKILAEVEGTPEKALTVPTLTTILKDAKFEYAKRPGTSPPVAYAINKVKEIGERVDALTNRVNVLEDIVRMLVNEVDEKKAPQALREIKRAFSPRNAGGQHRSAPTDSGGLKGGLPNSGPLFPIGQREREDREHAAQQSQYGR